MLIGVQQTSIPTGGGTLVLDNVDFTGSQTAVQNFDGAPVLAGGSVIQAWTQGQQYAGSTGSRVQAVLDAPPTKPAVLTANGAIFERSKPQYESYPASSFVSVKSAGAKGDGATDDTDAIQNAMNNLQDGQILYFDHGAYIITKTVNVPKNIKITGEIWPLIMASGAFFSNQDQPQPVFKIGEAGDVGAAEITDLMFETQGPAPGAILIQWNSAASEQGANGMWDVHARVGGSAGTKLQWDTCAKNPNVTHGPNPDCMGVHTMFHAAPTSSVYLENTWFWVADHELDLAAKPSQIDIYSGRGVFIESQGPMWMYGSASEHSVLYNYQLKNASNIYMGLIQTESPYFQSNPPAPAPFNLVADVDPPFDQYTDVLDKKAWGIRIVDSSDILVYGAGLYSFFENYDQVCVDQETCQNRVVSVEGTVNNLNLFGLSTKASVSMVSTAGGYVLAGSGNPNNGNARAVSSVSVLDSDNRSNFCATLALWRP
jgi:glucan 1,3-beta-glucosidase